MNPTGTLGEGLRLLADRLPAIIQQTLGPKVHNVEWTTILKEVDRRKDCLRETPGAYESGNLQTQLRVLTEPLANLGYPFDDHARTVSILAGELRNVRNNWTHTYDFSALQAFRALDSIARLLEHFHDRDGQLHSESLRNSLAPALLREIT